MCVMAGGGGGGGGGGGHGGMCGVVEERSLDQLEEGGRSGRSCWLLILRGYRGSIYREDPDQSEDKTTTKRQMRKDV